MLPPVAEVDASYPPGMNDDRTSPQTLSRQELYELVWTTPISRLATRFGLSDVGLAKICKKHLIPRPPRGYWARLQHGKRVRKARLPTLRDDALENIVIAPVQTVLRSRATDDPLPEPKQIRVTVSSSLTDPHPLVEKTRRSLEKAKVGEQGLLLPRARRILDVSISPATVERALCILDALLKTLESRGNEVTIEVEDDQSKAVAEIDGEAIPFCLFEDLLQEERALTPKELKEKEDWPWRYRNPVYQYTPSGRLVLRADTSAGYGARRRWADGKRRRVEDHLPVFIAALYRFAEELKIRRQEQEERRRRQEQWERERAEKLRLIQEEEERLKGLLADVEAWHQSQRIHAYIEDVVRRVEAARDSSESDEQLQAWASWASQHADRLDPLIEGPPSVLDEKSKWQSSYGPSWSAL